MTSGIGFVGASSLANNTITNPTVTLPSGISSGNIIALFVGVANGGTAVTITPPSGYTSLGTWGSESSGVGGQNGQVFWKRAAGTESGATLTFTLSTAAKASITAYVVSDATGTTTPTIVTGTDAQVSSKSHTSSAVAPMGNPGWIAVWWSVKSTTNASYTTPTGATFRTSAFGAGGGTADALLVDTNGDVSSLAALTTTSGTASTYGISAALLLSPGQTQEIASASLITTVAGDLTKTGAGHTWAEVGSSALATGTSGALTTATLPDDPTSVSAVAATDAVVISWTPPVQTVSGYIITSSQGDVYTISDSTAVSATISDLDPATVYTFVVQAFNLAGSSPGLAVTNAVQPLAPLSPPEGPYGPIDNPTPTPIPGVTLPLPVASTDPGVATNAGNVVLMYLRDDTTGDVLVLSPKGTGGLGLTDFDPGYPTVRESVFNLPARDGTFDASAYLGNSAVSLSLLAMNGMDADGVRQPAGYWVDVLASWLHPARRPTLVWQIQGQLVKQATLRASQFTAPFTSSGAGRSTVTMQVGWKNPTGVVYSPNPNPNMSVTPNDGRNMVTMVPSTTGLGVSFNLMFPITFGQSSDGSASVEYIGQVPTFTEIYLFGGAADPQFILEQSYDGQTWNVLPSQTLTFNGLNVANGDILRVVTGPSPSALVYTAAGAINNVRKYLGQPPQWWQISPGLYNRVRFNTDSSNAGTVGYVLYYDTFLR